MPNKYKASQPNPFAFPSETKGRFAMLIVVALAMTINIGVLFGFLAGSTLSELSKILEEMQQEVERLGGLGRVNASIAEMSSSELVRTSQVWLSLSLRQFFVLVKGLIGPGVAALLFTVAALRIYHRSPGRIQRRHGTKPLTRQEAPRLISEIEKLCSQHGLVVPRLEFQPGLVQAHAFGLPGREALLLHGSPHLLDTSWGESSKAVVLHELGHLANGDVQESEKVRAVWVLFAALFTGILSILFMVTGLLPPLSLLVKFAVVFLCVWAIKAGLIRIREFYADWRASFWGGRVALERVLALPERDAGWWEKFHWWWLAWARWGDCGWWKRAGRVGTWLWSQWRRFWRVHPSFDERRAVLRNPSRLFEISLDLPFLTGFLLTLVLVSSLPFVGMITLMASALAGIASSVIFSLAAGMDSDFERPLLISLANSVHVVFPFLVGTCFFFFLSFLLSRALGVQVQRQAVTHMMENHLGRWGYARLLIPALLLALGMEVGFWLTPFSPFGPGSSSAWVGIPAWLTSFTFFAWLWLAYTHGLSRLLLGTHGGGRDPYLRRSAVTLLSAALLTALFWPVIFARFMLLTISLLRPGMKLPIGLDARHAFVYYILTPNVVLLLLVTLVFSLWVGASLFVVWLGALQKQHRCPRCNEAVPFQIILGRSCRGCGGDLSPWAFVQPEAAGGEEGP